METPTLEIQHYDIDFAEQARLAERREYATYLAKWAVTAPFKATAVLAKGIGTALVHNVQNAYEDWELRSHDERYGTHLYNEKQRQLIEARTHRLVQKVGL